MYIQKNDALPKLNWNQAKSRRLKQTRGISFEEIIQTRLVDVIEHPREKHQRIMVFEWHAYIWAVPFVDSGDRLFLKTIYPSRKLTKQYLQECE